MNTATKLTNISELSKPKPSSSRGSSETGIGNFLRPNRENPFATQKEVHNFATSKPLKHTTMRRYMMTMMMAMATWMGASAMDYKTAREQAYYLTDKMAYELNLNDQQYNDAYEINLDYLLSVNTEADLADVRYLTYRNDDLRHILYEWQWATFVAVDYLFRPLWWRSGAWYFPVYDYYAHGYYFYRRPTIFWDYRGGHGRFYFSRGYYYNRRPVWHGGLRGMHRSLVGHPAPGHGRYGSHRGNFEHRGDGSFNNRGGGRDGHYNNGRGSIGNGRGYSLGTTTRGGNNRGIETTRSTGRDNTLNQSERTSTSRSGSSRGYHIEYSGNTRNTDVSNSSTSRSSNSRSVENSGSSRGYSIGSVPSSSRTTVTNSHVSTSRGSSMTSSSRNSSFSSSSRSSNFSSPSRSSNFSSSRSGSISSSSRSGGFSGGSSRGGESRGGSSRGGGRR